MNDPGVAHFLDHHGWTGEPEELMARLCTGLLAETECTVPVDVRRLASFRGARVEEVDQPLAGLLTWDGQRLVIHVRASDVEGRRRFTVCHEVCHTFFPGFRESPRTRAEPDVERFDPKEPEEYLCDLGAAELLLPRESLQWLLSDDFTIDDVLRLAEHFRASIEATARRCVALSTRPVAVVVLEPAWKPTEPRALAIMRGDPPGFEAVAPPRRLRVRWAASHGLPDIPPHMSVAENSPLGCVLRDVEIAYRGETGLIPGDLDVTARAMPYARDGVRIDRALALLRPCSEE